VYFVTIEPKTDLALVAHLMRRAGFGSTLSELEDLAKNSYETIVDDLVDALDIDWMGEYIVRRFDTEASGMINPPGSQRRWMYRLISSNAPLKEKMTLFWHGIFPAGRNKVINGRVLSDQIDMFRKYSLDRFDNILLQLAKDPAMIVWLDNQENHKDSINENWGRELLELFSMGVGNYTENDIKECARAFTGWSIGNTDYMITRADRDSDWPYGRIAYHYEFKDYDNDKDSKKFLGFEGPLSGEKVIEIICSQESAARFISRHLYHSFVADEVGVPSWNEIAPKDPEAIQILIDAYFKYDHSIKEMLRVLFNSEFFKSPKVRYGRIKSPAELAVGLLRISKEFSIPNRDMIIKNRQVQYMGQQLNDPPSVEGWHEGEEWVDTGTLMERVNFASEQLGDMKNTGISQLVSEIEKSISDSSPEELIAVCARHMGLIELSTETKESLKELANTLNNTSTKIPAMLRMIGASREYQRA
jgi:uncharacterized protein (DUF1800 family)